MRVLPGVKTMLDHLTRKVEDIRARTEPPTEAVDVIILINRAMEQADKCRDMLKDYLRHSAEEQGLGQGGKTLVNFIGAIGSVQVVSTTRAPSALKTVAAAEQVRAMVGTDVFTAMYARQESYAPAKNWRQVYDKLPPEVQRALVDYGDCWAPEQQAGVKVSK